jgi:hypothetical protein
MGNFFKSPQQQASESLYGSALSGQPVGAGLVEGEYGKELYGLRSGATQRSSSLTGDILSRNASEGGIPSSSTEATIGKGTAGIWEQEQLGETQLGANLDKSMLSLTLNDLAAGLSGMSTSSTFGDLLGGLTTLSNVGGGLFKLLSETGLDKELVKMLQNNSSDNSADISADSMLKAIMGGSK